MEVNGHQVTQEKKTVAPTPGICQPPQGSRLKECPLG